MTEKSEKKTATWLIYDGECPICSLSAKMLKVRKAVGHFYILNAREPHPLVEEMKAAGLNIDSGLVLKFQDHFYYGPDALHMLAVIGSDSDWFNRLNVLLFRRSKWSAIILYPILKSIRAMALWFKGVPRLNNNNFNDPKQPIFQAVFGEEWENLPPVMRKHYDLLPYHDDMRVIEGKMNIHFTWLITLFSPILRLLNMLVVYKGENIPVTIYLRSKYQTNFLYFERTFYFPNKRPYHFFSHIEFSKKNEVIEYNQSGIGLKLNCFFQNEKVIYQQKSMVLKIFKKTIPLPISWLSGKVFLEKKAIASDAFCLNMKMTHPLFGTLYTYSGEFTIKT